MRRYIPISQLQKTASVAKPAAETPAPKPVSKALAANGTYHFTSRSSIKNEPKQDAAEIAFYDKGQSVHYDKTLEADGYKWISYISGSGMRRYIPISPLQKTATVATPAVETPAPKPVSKALASNGTYHFTSRSSIKNEPKQDAAEIAFYDKGQSVHYDKTLEADGYKWISYISGSGMRRYIAVEKLTSQNTSKTVKSSSSESSKPKTQSSTNSATIAVGDTIKFLGTFKVTANVSGGYLISSSDLAGGMPSALNYLDPTPVIETNKSGKKSGDQILYPGEYFSIPGKYKVSKVDKASNGICVKIGSRDTWVTMSKVSKQ
ncbi:SH3 domain-containing protein [Streptococcus sp. ZJ99]